MPLLDVAEDDRAFRVAVELPGLSEEDVSVSLTDRTPTIRGEKKQEKDLKDRNVYRSERAYGAFRRVSEVPTDVDADKIEALARRFGGEIIG
jgi:HSP20 family protein